MRGTVAVIPPIKVYYWNARENFGDGIAPLLIERFTDRKAVWERVGKADVVSVGSVLEHLPAMYDGYVLGSGKLYEESRIYLDPNCTNVLALRGPLSAKSWRKDCAIGDPGLLASDLIYPQSKKYDLGIIPHWSDKHLASDPRFYGKWDTLVIRPSGNPLEVIESIAQCRKVVSSSLHGLIVADAFGIPRRFEYAAQFDREGGKFKFEDYSASIGAKLTVSETYTANPRNVASRKNELWDSYRMLDNLLR
ncbi:MAG: polysaccharide pyruvyl transferase family protein [Candidatus Saccharimonadales bacterium]